MMSSLNVNLQLQQICKNSKRCFEDNDLEGFKQALQNGASVNDRIHERNGLMYSIFELVCEKPGSKEYIEVCKRYSANFYAQHPVTKDYPIHLAARSLDVENLQALLQGSTDLRFLNATNEDKTALFTIFAGLKADNIDKSMSCIWLLLDHGANINIPNVQIVPPIKYLIDLVEDSEVGEELRRTVRKNIEWMLNNYMVDLTFRSNQEMHRLQLIFPDIPKELIERGSYSAQGSIAGLMNLLSELQTVDDETEFLRLYQEQYLPTIDRSNDPRLCQEHRGLLTKTIEIGCLEISSIIFKELNKKNTLCPMTPTEEETFYSSLLEKCCHRRHDKLLEWLLKQDPASTAGAINKVPLLSRLIIPIEKEKKTEHQINGFTKCLNILLADSRVNINATDDCQGGTALYYAAKYGNDEATREILRKGAFIGARNVRYLPLLWISEEQLKSHLDSCIINEHQEDNEGQEDNEDYQVQFYLKNFLPPEELRMTVAETLLQLEELQHIRSLLLHPVPATLLMLEWRKLWVLLCLNCGLSFVGCATLIFTLLLRPIDRTDWHYAAALTALIYFTLRESVQIYISGFVLYIQSKENVLELCLIGYCTASLTLGFSPIVAFFLAAAEIMIVLSSLELHSFSTTLLSLRKIARNVIIQFFLFSGLIAAIAGSIHVLLGEDEPTEDHDGSVKDDNQFNRFNRMPLAFVKSFIMITGKFEATSLGLDQSNGEMIFLVFFVFILFTMSILMNGTAVSDTLKIKSDEKLLSIKHKLLVIKKYEKWAEARHNAVCTLRLSNQQDCKDAPLAQTSRSGCVSLRPNRKESFSPVSLLLGRHKNKIEKTICRDALRIVQGRNRNTSTSIENRLSSVETVLTRLTESVERLALQNPQPMNSNE